MPFNSSFENKYRWVLTDSINEETMSISDSDQDGLTWTQITFLCKTTNKTQPNEAKQKNAGY